MENEFDKENMDDEYDELWEEMGEIAEMFQKASTGVFEVNPEKVNVVETIYNTMTHIISGENIQIEYEYGELSPDFGSISITGSRIVVDNPALFVKAVEIASNYDMYPKTDGKVVIDIGVYGIAEKRGISDEKF